MNQYSIWCTAMTPAGVSFPVNVVVHGLDEKQAAIAAVQHLLQYGGAVILSPGQEPIPTAVVAAIPQRIDLHNTNVVSVAHQLPKPMTN